MITCTGLGLGEEEGRDYMHRAGARYAGGIHGKVSRSMKVRAPDVPGPLAEPGTCEVLATENRSL